MNALRLLVIAGLAALAAAACGGSIDQLARRASLDLKCAEDKLEFAKVDERTRAVRGCGSQAVYVESCNPADECTWVLNSDISPADAE